LSLGVSDQAFVAAQGEIQDCSGGEGEAYDPCTAATNFLYAKAADPVQPISGCIPDDAGSSWGEDGALFNQPVVAAEGSAIALAMGKNGVCGKTSAVQVVDLVNPGASVMIPGSAEYLDGIAMAGSYVAVLTRRTSDGPSLVVKIFNRETKAVVTTRKFFATRYKEESIDIQADGTFALSGELYRDRSNVAKRRPLCARRSAVVVVKLGGDPRCVDLNPATEEVKLADSKLIAYEQRRGDVARLVAVDTDTGAKQIIRTTTDAFDEPFDFDGKRLVWAETGCEHNSIKVVDFGPSISSPQIRCPISVANRTITLKNRSKFTLQVTCPLGCGGLWDLSGPKQIDSKSKIHDGEVQFYDGEFMWLHPSASPQRNAMTFYYHVSDYLRKHPLKRIALTWISYQASIDGRHHEKKIWFKVKYR
ncbi:MAG: hypothetical protein ACRDKE_09395, partial [Solirubrobacterales bacterium]